MQTTIRRVGNAKAVLLPSAFIKHMGFDDLPTLKIRIGFGYAGRDLVGEPRANAGQ